MPNFKKYINPARYSKDGKTVIANFGYLSLLQIASYLFPLITMPYLARVIGTAGFGKIAFAAAIIGWCQTIADWGFTYTATRDVAQNRDDKEKISQIFSDVLWARFLLTILSFIFLLFTIALIPSFRENQKVILVTFLLIPGHLLFPEWFFQALERMKYTTFFNLSVKLFFTLAVFLFIKKPEDYILQPIFTSIAFLICGIISLVLIIGKWKIKLFRPNIKKSISAIKSSFDVFLNNLMPNLYNSFSILLLGVFSGNTANGILDGGNKFVTVFSQLQSVFSRAFYPFLSRKINYHKLYVRIIVLIAFLFAFFLFFTAPAIVRIALSEEFSNSALVIRILAISLVFLAISNAYGTNYLVVIHKERQLRKVTIIGSLIGFIISIPLVYYFSYIGAALTICISRAILAVLTYFCAKRNPISH